MAHDRVWRVKRSAVVSDADVCATPLRAEWIEGSVRYACATCRFMAFVVYDTGSGEPVLLLGGGKRFVERANAPSLADLESGAEHPRGGKVARNEAGIWENADR